MNKKIKKNLLVFGSILVIAGGLIFLGLQTNVFSTLQETAKVEDTAEKNSEAGTKRNYPAADFQLQLLNSEGEEVNLEEFRGKVIFMNLWATWCPPCIVEMPDIENLYRDLKDEDIVFIMLSLDHKFQKAVDFVEKNNYSFEIYETVKGMPDMYITQSIPTTFVINAEGELVLTHIGMGDFDTAEFREFLLEQK
ncbi:TlpA family protein disulfide reductase [Antarcticibacterium flavum]|uniref:TlpA family protein disulfide reductase n=1 Tax=Antarcticibacterium flavum TaxID=2058175 RepID=A0A5B7X7U9_9FLAO|nr:MULTISPECIES: TlpA disulfide reductase family protein [Antarcticibacterium]MCM4160682.1 thioredoxin [Antarcticibacterium sp. W02-3]QCY71170.1 TlpA family protein disulfide reductase [Antarcticibacterium flavum]